MTTGNAGGRQRIVGPTIYCGVISKRIKTPKPAGRTGGKFFCIICGSNFTRAEGVNYHFRGCVEVYGNPQGNRWNDHPSCASRKTRRKPTAASDNPPEKKRRSEPSAGPSAVEPRNQKPTTRAAPVAETSAQTTEHRVTRSEALRSRLSQGKINIETSSVPKSKATKPSTSQPKRSQAKPNQNQNAAIRGRSRPQPRSKVASGIGKRSKYEVEENLPPLHEPGPIFQDLTLNALSKTPFKDALKTLSKKQINIATMCSGTESPLLALAEIQNGKSRPWPLI